MSVWCKGQVKDVYHCRSDWTCLHTHTHSHTLLGSYPWVYAHIWSHKLKEAAVVHTYNLRLHSAYTPRSCTKQAPIVGLPVFNKPGLWKSFQDIERSKQWGKWHWGFHGNCCKLLRGLLWKHMSDLTGMFTVSLATDSRCSLSHCLARHSLL